MAEWLGTALQKLLQRFESAFDLEYPADVSLAGYFVFVLREPASPAEGRRHRRGHTIDLFNFPALSY